jgi:hypothetical protein
MMTQTRTDLSFELAQFRQDTRRVLQALWGDSNFQLDALARRQAY